MKTINFKSLTVKQDIAGLQTHQTDVATEFAQVIFEKSTGIAGHALSLKIYQSEGEIEINETEESIIIETMNQYCVPRFIDAVQTALKPNDHADK